MSMGNPVVQWQMVSPDPDQSARFYGKLFGWRTTQQNAMGYRVVRTSAEATSDGVADVGAGAGVNGGARARAGASLDGGIWPAPPQAPGFMQLFVEVPDVDACLSTAVSLGATVIIPTSHLPDGDTMAVLRDPCGITVGVCRTARTSQPSPSDQDQQLR
jgi:uncharacterized protein